jgi:hypothetical protein
MSCPIESSCKHSAKRQYLEKNLDMGNTRWPVKIVIPEIEDLWETQGKQKVVDRLLDVLSEDYGPETPQHEVESRNWFGRCVWECDNDVCDDQSVTISWNDDPVPQPENEQTATTHPNGLNGRGAKSAQFHMVAFTEKVCERRGYMYGTEGEIRYDSNNIRVTDFKTGYTKVHHVPAPPDSGHGGGDDELALNMIRAVIAVQGGETVDEAQWNHLGCTLEEMVRSHAAVFAAEEARTQNKVVDWAEYWGREVDARLKDLGLPI